MFLVFTYCFRYGIGRMRRKGFSLLELVVVLAIMGTLAAVAVPVYSNVTDNSSTGALVSSADGIVKSANSRAQSDPLNPGRGTTINDIVLAAGDEDVELLAGDGATSGVRIYGQKDLCINVSITGSASGSVAVSGDPYECLSGSPATTSTTAPSSNNSTTTTAAPTTTTTVALTCATGGTCVVGDTGPGGGIVFYVHSSGTFPCGPTLASTCTYLEAAPARWSPSSRFDIDTYDPQYHWTNAPLPSTVGSSAQNSSIGSGLRNSAAILTLDPTTTTAAYAARSYTGGGKLDWYLPAQDELLEMLRMTPTVVPGLSLLHGYWSSTEWSSLPGHGALGAYKNPASGQGGYGKGNTFKVRPIRAG